MVAQIDKHYVKLRPSKVVSRLVSYGLFEGRPLTTKGRWINPLVFMHFALERALPAMRDVKAPVFVIGTGRSGTTILGVVMSMHKDVGFLNEPKALWHAGVGFEDVIGSYTRAPARYRLDASDCTDAIRLNIRKMFGAYLASVMSSRLVDKYPELVFRVPFVKSIFPDARFVFLVRNGWDTCASIDKWSRRLGVTESGEVQDWWGADNRKWKLMLNELIATDELLRPVIDEIRGFSRHTDMAAVEWIVTMREGLRRKREYPDDVHMVRYEDMVQSPRQVLGEVLRFCGLPDDPVFFEYAETVLSPAPMHDPFELPRIIRPQFEQTMRELGYGEAS
jgi:hypothetical protein